MSASRMAGVRVNDACLRPALLAGLVILLGGAAVRLVDYRLRQPATALGNSRLEELPRQFERWSGVDAPLDAAVARVADVDAYLCRVYSDRASRKSVTLYVADGVRTRDLLPHRPDVCYPAAGWTLRSAQTIDVPLDDAAAISATLYCFDRSGLSGGQVAVLNFFIMDGRVTPSVERLQAAIWRGAAPLQQVQITCSDYDPAGAGCGDVVGEFARRAGPSIVKLLGAPSGDGR